MVHLITLMLLFIFIILLVWVFVMSYRLNVSKDSQYHIIEEVEKEPLKNDHEMPEATAPSDTDFFQEDDTVPNQLEEGRVNIQDIPSLQLDTLVASKGIHLKAKTIDIDVIKSDSLVQMKFHHLTSTSLHGGLMFLNFGMEHLKQTCLHIARSQKKSRAVQRYKAVHDDLHIPPYSIIEKPIYCRKDLIVEEGVIFLDTIQVDGNLKAKSHVTFKHPVTVNKNMSVGPYSRTQSYLFVKNKLMIEGPFFFLSAKKEEKSFVIGRKVTLKNMIIGSGDVISLDKKSIDCYAE